MLIKNVREIFERINPEISLMPTMHSKIINRAEEYPDLQVGTDPGIDFDRTELICVIIEIWLLCDFKFCNELLRNVLCCEDLKILDFP